MVPIMLEKDFHRDKLQVFAEPYNTLIVSKDGFINPIPKIKGLAPKENIKAWVDRKLFIHNLGHVSAAYIGYLYNSGFVYLWEALDVPQIFDYVREIMLQASSILITKYPNVFSTHELIDHIDDLLFRFRNKALGDTLFRVGCDLKRKLSAHDRLAAPIRMGLEFNLPYDKILFAMVCGIHFRAHNEKGNMLDEDVDFVNAFNGNIPKILTNISGFNRNEHAQLFHEAQTVDNRIRDLKFSNLLT
jgi:mannitol-1-phosphate 5-dehydrogenase